MDTWTLTFTDANGRIGRRTYDNETAFISAVLDKLTDPGASNYWRSCLRDGVGRAGLAEVHAAWGGFMK